MGRTPSPSRAQDPALKALTDAVWRAYPARPVPEPFVPLRTALDACRRAGATDAALVQAAYGYAAHVAQQGTAPEYRLGAVRFYRDGIWVQYAEPRVEGRTRAEWARSGQDVAVFDAALTLTGGEFR